MLKGRRSRQRLEIEALETSVIFWPQVPTPPTEILHTLEKMRYVMAVGYFEGESSVIGILVGSDHYWDLVSGRVTLLEIKLQAVETAFGWTVQGPTVLSARVVQCSQTIVLKACGSASSKADRNAMVKKFWDLFLGIVSEFEEPASDSVRKYSEETVTTCEQRYEVALSWKPAVCLGDNRQVAEKRLVQLTKRLGQNKKTPVRVRHH